MGDSAFSKALINIEVACATGGEKLDYSATVCGMTADHFKILFEADPTAAFQSFIVGLANIDEAGECGSKSFKIIVRDCILCGLP